MRLPCIDITGTIGNTIKGLITSVIGEDIFNGISKEWKKLSAIYTSAVNIVELTQNSMAGIAEGLQTTGQYTGKIGNALKKGGVILENAYEWMDENLRVKTGKFATVQAVTDGIQNVNEVVDNLTEVSENVQETTENITQIQSEFKSINDKVKENEDTKKTTEADAKTASQSAPIAKPDLVTPGT